MVDANDEGDLMRALSPSQEEALWPYTPYSGTPGGRDAARLADACTHKNTAPVIDAAAPAI